MNYLKKHQFNIIVIAVMAIIISILFNKPLTGEYIFGGPDTLSPSAINAGIEKAHNKYGDKPQWLPWVFSGLPTVHSFQNISDYYLPNIVLDLFKSLGLPGF